MTDDRPAPGHRPEDHLQITRLPADEGTVALKLEGDLDPYTAPLLTEQLDGALDDHVRTVELDMSGVRFLDSSGLRVLVVAYNELEARGGEIVLVSPTANTRRVIELAGLDSTLQLRP